MVLVVEFPPAPRPCGMRNHYHPGLAETAFRCLRTPTLLATSKAEEKVGWKSKVVISSVDSDRTRSPISCTPSSRRSRRKACAGGAPGGSQGEGERA